MSVSATHCSGGHHEGYNEEQSQCAKHDNFFKKAAIEFVWHLSLPITVHMTIRIANNVMALLRLNVR